MDHRADLALMETIPFIIHRTFPLSTGHVSTQRVGTGIGVIVRLSPCWPGKPITDPVWASARGEGWTQRGGLLRSHIPLTGRKSLLKFRRCDDRLYAVARPPLAGLRGPGEPVCARTIAPSTANTTRTPPQPRCRSGYAGLCFLNRIFTAIQGRIQRNDKLTTQAKQRRVHFSEVAIGQKFFDLISAEYFIKQSDETAVMVSGIGDGVTPDDFEPDDVVRIDE